MGLMAGYVGSKVGFDDSLTSTTFSGGNVGAYATLLHGGFFADFLAKADVLDMKFNNNIFGAQSVGVVTYGARLDTGYRFNWHTAWFAEPLATIEYVKSDLSNLV